MARTHEFKGVVVTATTTWAGSYAGREIEIIERDDGNLDVAVQGATDEDGTFVTVASSLNEGLQEAIDHVNRGGALKGDGSTGDVAAETDNGEPK